MLKNLFGKGKGKGDDAPVVVDDAQSASAAGDMMDMMQKMGGGMGEPDLSKMNMVQKMAWKQFQKLSPEKQREVMQKAMTPENIQKHKGEIIQQLDQMKQMGMMSDDQYRMAKKKFGL